MALTDVTGVTLTGMWSYLRKETSTSWQKWTGAPQRSGNSQPVAECDPFTTPGCIPRAALQAALAVQATERHQDRCDTRVWRSRQDLNLHTLSGYSRISKPFPYHLGLLLRLGMDRNPACEAGPPSGKEGVIHFH